MKRRPTIADPVFKPPHSTKKFEAVPEPAYTAPHVVKRFQTLPDPPKISRKLMPLVEVVATPVAEPPTPGRVYSMKSVMFNIESCSPAGPMSIPGRVHVPPRAPTPPPPPPPPLLVPPPTFTSIRNVIPKPWPPPEPEPGSRAWKIKQFVKTHFGK